MPMMGEDTDLPQEQEPNVLSPFSRKFGKHIQKRQLDIPEYAASFVDYKALKKVCLFWHVRVMRPTLMCCPSS
jgi:hypothetical protein